MIYMKILKKRGGSREKWGWGNEIHAPCTCGPGHNIFIYTCHIHIVSMIQIQMRERCGHDRTIVGFTTTCAISAHHHYSYKFQSHSWLGVLYTTLSGKVCQWLVVLYTTLSGKVCQWLVVLYTTLSGKVCQWLVAG
jgi:hypothetical protein